MGSSGYPAQSYSSAHYAQGFSSSGYHGCHGCASTSTPEFNMYPTPMAGSFAFEPAVPYAVQTHSAAYGNCTPPAPAAPQFQLPATGSFTY